MLFSEFYKIMVNEVTFAGFRGSPPLDPPLTLLRPEIHRKVKRDQDRLRGKTTEKVFLTSAVRLAFTYGQVHT